MHRKISISIKVSEYSIGEAINFPLINSCLYNSYSFLFSWKMRSPLPTIRFMPMQGIMKIDFFVCIVSKIDDFLIISSSTSGQHNYSSMRNSMKFMNTEVLTWIFSLSRTKLTLFSPDCFIPLYMTVNWNLVLGSWKQNYSKYFNF